MTNKLDFLRPKQFSVAARGGSAAYIQKNGIRVNSDGTTIRERKPYLKIRSNHRHPVIPSRIVFAGGTAINNGGGYERKK